jgi:hypothetical protein
MFSVSLFFLSGFIVSKKSPAGELEKRLVRLFKNQESAKNIGLEYLKIVPEESSREKLLSMLSSTLERFPNFYEENNPRILLKWLRTCRQEDFKENRIIIVKKWLLSVTELRLCALVALQPSLTAHNLARVFSFQS